MKNEINQTIVSFLAGVLVCLSASNSLNAQQSEPRVSVDFNRQIKPILSDRCFLCHGPDSGTREADLRLDLESEAAAVIESGDSASSELFDRISSQGDDQMPPIDSKLELTDQERVLIRRWIDEGASWEQHWSFVKPRKYDPPTNQNRDWESNQIDAFVLQQLELNQLLPAPQAPREKLLRRVSFDLTGLPPTPDELDAFLEDQHPDAYERVVDRLLGNQRFGERMASDWLDVARFSDTYGYQVDRDRFVWPWRDWVVRAFNQNMGYDQFITEQLAGDLLPEASDDQILATTFNRLHPQKVEGGSVEEEFRVEYVADRSQTVGMAFMGLTVECARCHDHKYDPISQREYYQLFSFFNNIDESGLYSYFDAGAVPTPTLLLRDGKQKHEQAELESNEMHAVSRLNHYFVSQFLGHSINTLNSPDTHQTLFSTWLADARQRQASAQQETPGLKLVVDFKTTVNRNNELVEGPDGRQAIQLTGDDEVKIDAGSFRRHQPFTIATQIRIPANAQLAKRAVIFHRSRAWTDSASRGYQLLIEDGRLSASLIHFWPGDAISVRTVDPVDTETWQHVAVAYDGSSRASGIKIYLNGIAIPIEIVRDNLQKTIVGNGTDQLVLGARFRDIGFKDGQMADFRIYDRCLAALEITRLVDEHGFDENLEKPTEQIGERENRELLDYYLEVEDLIYADLQRDVLAARKALNDFTDGLKEIMVMREMAELRPAYVLARGAYDAPADPVLPATPAVFPDIPNGSPMNRLGLAHWLTQRSHPLTARVAVNHYWQLCFGQGLVRTPEDFGSQGEPPTHPKLLDWLAVDFQEQGWDVKRLLKQIVMSSTYQQSTKPSAELQALDPDNRLLARASTYRLSAEMIRDNVLMTSGLLVEKLGGPPVRPYELAESFQPSQPDSGEGLYRRSLYTYWKRTGPAPAMMTLDAAKRDVCQLKRERTSSPLAALVQLNSPQTVEASRKLAESLILEHGDQDLKIVSELFRRLTSRRPTDQEQVIIRELWESQLEHFRADNSAALSYLEIGQSRSKTDQPARLAALAVVVNTMFNFDECVMKR